MNINLNKLFTLWMTSDKKDLIENLMEKTSLHKNWGTSTWQAKDSKTFNEIDSLGNELGYGISRLKSSVDLKHRSINCWSRDLKGALKQRSWKREVTTEYMTVETIYSLTKVIL